MMLITFFLSGVSIFWINKIRIRSYLFIVLIGCLLSAEFFLVMAYWPVSYFISGIVLTLFFFAYYGILRMQLIGRLTKKMVRNYIIFIVLGLILVLFSARWT